MNKTKGEEDDRFSKDKFIFFLKEIATKMHPGTPNAYESIVYKKINSVYRILWNRNSNKCRGYSMLRCQPYPLLGLMLQKLGMTHAQHKLMKIKWIIYSSN